ncbi:MAG: hypothetical protein AAGL34_06440 [Bacteroidota bacterium]
MKNLLKTLTLISILALTSCSNEETTANGSENDQAITEMEQTPLAANDVADNVVINGGTKNAGVPPTPNEAISLDVSSSSSTAFLGEGFDIEITSDAVVVGAYLQFKSNDGVVSDSYYDIDLNSNAAGKASRNSFDFSRKLLKSASKEENDTTLDVDFNTNIAPGTFCYVICVYDGEGNISAPSEVCVTVEAWGGNSSLVANWELTKEENITPDETFVFEVGEPDCNEATLSCDGAQQSVSFEFCSTQDYGIMEIRSDGTFSLDFKGTEEDYDFNTATSTCEVAIEELEYRVQINGNWAYVNDENRLTLVGYSFLTLDFGETQEEFYSGGNGELVYDGLAQIDGNTLLITERYASFSDDVIDSSYNYYFEK